MDDNPVLLVLVIVAGGYFGSMWLEDYRASRAGTTAASSPLPGATPAPLSASVIAAIGALALLAAETLGEIALGISDEQSTMTAWFALYSLVAAFIEEIVFRGYLVVDKRGRAALVAGAVGASVLFAALHPFVWQWDDDGFAFTFTAKGWFSFGAVFAVSLWFYYCRFARWNPAQSLIPCFAAHLAKNVGVIAIKGAQGFLTGF